ACPISRIVREYISFSIRRSPHSIRISINLVGILYRIFSDLSRVRRRGTGERGFLKKAWQKLL
ncbi:MAG: hypothetical protein PT954_10185, partial [Eubacteriales bacterium]|nr:hypothetical protein [Eubacteriales bacterium]